MSRILTEVGFGSNYLVRLDTNASNYIITTSNLLVNRILTEVGFGSNYARDRVGVWNSNYTDLVGRWGSNYVDKLNAIAIVSSQWTTSTTNPRTIFYNNGSIGIGTTNPIANLHIYSSNAVNGSLASSKLIIQESNTSNVLTTVATDITSVPSVSPLSISGTIDKYVVYTYTADNTGEGQTAYSITLPENYSYDVLMVAGGGGGGGNIGAGGGGGEVLYCSNIRIPAGNYDIKVGNGGNGSGQNGFNTTGFNTVCIGGGGAKNIIDSAVIGEADGNYGGSGSGGKSVSTGNAGAGGMSDVGGFGQPPAFNDNILKPATRFGNIGGSGVSGGGGSQILSGGGGGAGSAGKAGKIAASYLAGDGNGGSGVQINITGGSLFWGAGGGGGANNVSSAGNGGRGGGGTGVRSGTAGNMVTAVAGGDAYSTAYVMNAAFGSGSGGGGGSATYQSNGGNGGAGIIIIRYRPLIDISGTPEMQLVIGDTIGAGGSNYKIGNYNGNFKIKTSTSNIDTSTFIMESMGNVGIGTSVITSKLHLYDNRQNATLTLQDNTSIATLIAPEDIYPVALDFEVTVPTVETVGLYEKMLVFTYSIDSIGYLGQSHLFFTTGEDLNADILVVGGGGAGGCFGGGGGAGQVLLTTNYNIPANTSVVVKVGKGGAGGSTVGINGEDGYESSIAIGDLSYIAKGGGGGGARNTTLTVTGNSGGSGGGSSSGNAAPASLGGVSTKTGYLDWKSFGNSGGIGTYKPTTNPDHHFAGGGGGAGYVGGTGIYSGVLTGATIGAAGSGGAGINLSSIFGNGVGALGFFGGGGGGMLSGYGALASGGVGGGGNGGGTGGFTSSAFDNTGGGGGGGSSVGGNGGTGVVIIKYRQKNIEGNSEIQLLKGASISSGKTNYKIGNYDGDYKVKSSSYNTDMDRFVIQSGGDIRFNNTSGMAMATIFNNGDFRTAGSQISDSDNRIKKDVVDIDEAGALRMIMEIEPKTYRYIDEERSTKCVKGGGSGGSGGTNYENTKCGSGANCESRIYGFIAQQIRDVIPDATELRKNFLPNIMKRAIMDNDRVYLDLTGFGDLPLNDVDRKINIRFKNGGGYNFCITEVNKEYFVIDNADRLIEEVFVYGYEVNDFHILTKDYIYTLNVSATQELCRKMEAQERRIKELEDMVRER